MSITNTLAGIAVANLSAAYPWYERLLGRAADERTAQRGAEWRFDGASIRVFADGGRAGSSCVTLVVDDIERQVQVLADRYFAVGDPTQIAQTRSTTVRDPDGNQIVFAESNP